MFFLNIIFLINLNQKLIAFLIYLNEMLAHSFKRIIKPNVFLFNNYRTLDFLSQKPRYYLFFKKPSEKMISNFEKINAEKNYYQILEISESANNEEIKQAYYKLAKQYHPDRNSSKDALSKFKDVNEAYEVLVDENLRNIYDEVRNPEQNEDQFQKKFNAKFQKMSEKEKIEYRKKILIGALIFTICGLTIVGGILYTLYKYAKKWFSSKAVPLQNNLQMFGQIGSDRLKVVNQQPNNYILSNLPYGYAPYKYINFYGQTTLQRYFASMNIEYDPKIFTSTHIKQLQQLQSKTQHQ